MSARMHTPKTLLVLIACYKTCPRASRTIRRSEGYSIFEVEPLSGNFLSGTHAHTYITYRQSWKLWRVLARLELQVRVILSPFRARTKEGVNPTSGDSSTSISNLKPRKISSEKSSDWSFQPTLTPTTRILPYERTTIYSLISDTNLEKKGGNNGLLLWNPHQIMDLTTILQFPLEGGGYKSR